MITLNSIIVSRSVSIIYHLRTKLTFCIFFQKNCRILTKSGAPSSGKLTPTDKDAKKKKGVRFKKKKAVRLKLPRRKKKSTKIPKMSSDQPPSPSPSGETWQTRSRSPTWVEPLEVSVTQHFRNILHIVKIKNMKNEKYSSIQNPLSIVFSKETPKKNSKHLKCLKYNTDIFERESWRRWMP